MLKSKIVFYVSHYFVKKKALEDSKSARNGKLGIFCFEAVPKLFHQLAKLASGGNAEDRKCPQTTSFWSKSMIFLSKLCPYYVHIGPFPLKTGFLTNSQLQSDLLTLLVMICEIGPEYCRKCEKKYTHGIFSWINTARIILNATTAPNSKSRWILHISLLPESM